MRVTVSGTTRSGKTAALQLIKCALEEAGMQVTVEDLDGDFKNARHPEVLAGREVTLHERREFSPSLFAPIRALNQDVG